MKKYFKNILLFALFAFFLYSIFLFIAVSFFPEQIKKNIFYIPIAYGHSFTRFSEVDTVENIDILFLGSSHAYRGFDTRIFEKYGYKTFNLGSSSQTPLQTEVLLNRYLEKLNPKIIIFDVNPMIFSMKGEESAYDLISNDINDINSFFMTLQLNHTKIFNTFLFATTIDIFKLNKNLKEETIKNDDTYIKGGYVQKDISYFKIQNEKEDRWIKIKNQNSAFERIVNKIKSKEIKLILVQAPITLNLKNSYSNNSEFDDYVKKFSTYYNFNELLKLDDSLHFFNSHHLNQNGVEIFNEELIKILKKNNL